MCIRIPFGLAWSVRPKIIVGQVLAFGRDAHLRMNRYFWILTRFSGDEAEPRVGS